MKRVLVLGVFSFVLVNCSAFKAAARGDISGAAQGAAGDIAAGAQKIADAKKQADADCEPLNARVGKGKDVPDTDEGRAKALDDARAKGFGVAWPEERAIGGAIAIGFGKSGKGPYIDITEKDPKVLKDKVDANKGKRDTVKLTASEKNDLNTYVQLVGNHVAAGSTRPGIAWTFGVIDNDETVNAYSTPGGYVLVTTGLLKLMENEAQLAGVLGHEIGHITQRHAVKLYAKGKAFACNIAVTGYYIVEAGASNVPGGEEFVKNAKFGKTMKAFARPEGVDMDKDKDVDVAFMQWFTNRIIDGINLSGNAKEDEYEADRIAFELMAAAGYDTKELEKIITALPSGYSMFAHHPSNSDRVEAIGKLRTDGAFGADGGKAPKFPANVKWPPKPAS